MSKPQILGTEFDSFFVKEKDIQSKNQQELQKNINAEMQNYEIAESQNNEITKLQKVRKTQKQKVAKRDDPNYTRITTAIKRSKVKAIKDYMWEKGIKNFDDALELFISDKPLR